MFESYFHPGLVSVQNGRSNGRSFCEYLHSGKIQITGIGAKGEEIKRTAFISNGQIQDMKLEVNGTTQHHVIYGQFETKQSETGRNIIHFNPKTGTGKHGKSRKYHKLFEVEGVCHGWYSNGRLIRQKFIYHNGIVAYNHQTSKNFCIIKDYTGKVMFEIKGKIDYRDNFKFGADSIFDKSLRSWCIPSVPFEIKENGVVVYSGQTENEQRTGRWIENGEVLHYLHGVALPEKYYLMKPEEIDVTEALNIKNAQLRMAVMSKVPPDKIAQCGRVIHKDKDMRLYDIKGFEVRMLRVKCPSTNSFYYLRVPKDSRKCEEARQWTFGVGQEFRQPINFEVEV